MVNKNSETLQFVNIGDIYVDFINQFRDLLITGKISPHISPHIRLKNQINKNNSIVITTDGSQFRLDLLSSVLLQNIS